MLPRTTRRACSSLSVIPSAAASSIALCTDDPRPATDCTTDVASASSGLAPNSAKPAPVSPPTIAPVPSKIDPRLPTRASGDCSAPIDDWIEDIIAACRSSSFVRVFSSLLISPRSLFVSSKSLFSISRPNSISPDCAASFRIIDLCSLNFLSINSRSDSCLSSRSPDIF